MDEIVPFGKYRGRAVAELVADREYSEWLMAQAWFRERHASLYTIVINGGSAPQDTPEHNALQALFLDHDFRVAVVEARWPSWLEQLIDSRLNTISGSTSWNQEERIEIRHICESIRKGECRLVSKVKFETKNGIDVCVQVMCYAGDDRYPWFSREVNVEIKPTVGDDYPTILRQMKAEKADTLFLSAYIGVGITEERFVKIFENEEIGVVFRSRLPSGF